MIRQLPQEQDNAEVHIFLRLAGSFQEPRAVSLDPFSRGSNVTPKLHRGMLYSLCKAVHSFSQRETTNFCLFHFTSFQQSAKVTQKGNDGLFIL